MLVRIAQRRQIQGWGFSLILHGILLSAIWPAISHLPAPIHPEPFQWNVAFVESPQQTTAVEPSSDSSSAREFPQTVEAGKQRPAFSTPDLPSPAQQLKNDLTESLRESDTVKPMIAESPPTAFARAQSEILQPKPSTTEPTPVIQETLPMQRESDEQPKTMIATTPIPAEPFARSTSPLEQDQDLPPTLAPPSPVPSVNSAQPSAPRADYSWLQRAVSHRLEELKRSSRPSLDDSSPLKVLVKAVVSNTGELMEAEIVKSSGLNRIDQEAMTLVQRAFPMPLDHVLDRQQIVMRIPITYSRD